MRNSVLVLMLVALLGIVAAPRAKASEMDKKTNVTFHEAIEIPGMILPAGDYVMKRADNNLPDVVRFTNRAENHVYATIFALPTYRQVPTSDVVFVFDERASNAPPAMKKWFYPGDTVGAEFVYPKSRGTLMAMNTLTTTHSEPRVSSPAPAISEPAPIEHEEAVESQPAPAPEPELAQNQPMPSSSSTSSNTSTQSSTPPEPASNQLPQTGTELPLYGLIGLLCMTAGLGLRRLARSRS